MSEKRVGQKKAEALLAADLKAGRLAESYLFAGPQGVGKRTFALELAKAVNCRGPENKAEPEPDFLMPELERSALPAAEKSVWGCGECSSCRKIESGTHAEIFTLDFESQAALLELDEEEKARQKDYRIDSIRLLIHRSYLTSLESQKKVFIIDGAEFLNPESANALLKVLEESTRQTLWILLAVSLDRVLGTIRSRCRRVPFAQLSSADVLNILKRLADKSRGDFSEKTDWEEIARLCDGSVSAALSLLREDWEDMDALAEQMLMLDRLSGSEKAQASLQASAKIVSEARRTGAKAQADRFLKVLSLKMSQKLRRDPRGEGAQDLLAVLQSQENLRRNASPQMVLDALFLNLSGRG